MDFEFFYRQIIKKASASFAKRMELRKQGEFQKAFIFEIRCDVFLQTFYEAYYALENKPEELFEEIQVLNYGK